MPPAAPTFHFKVRKDAHFEAAASQLGMPPCLSIQGVVGIGISITWKPLRRMCAFCLSV